MSSNEQIYALIKEKGIVRPRDVEELGVSRVYLQRLYEQGKVERIGRGLYKLSEAPFSEYESLLEVAVRIPSGVICLISALSFYNLTTQLPFEVWLAIEGTNWKPQIDYPPLHVARFSGKAFHYGIKTHSINGTTLRVYSVAKTVADCFKYRNKIGLDIALDALRETINEKRTTIDEVWQAAKVCRVSNIIKPYLEAI